MSEVSIKIVCETYKVQSVFWSSVYMCDVVIVVIFVDEAGSLFMWFAKCHSDDR